MIFATFYSLMPMPTLIALNTILSLGIAGKIRSMNPLGQEIYSNLPQSLTEKRSSRKSLNVSSRSLSKAKYG